MGERAIDINMKLGRNIAASQADHPSHVPVHDHCALWVTRWGGGSSVRNDRGLQGVNEALVEKLRDIIARKMARKGDSPPAFSVSDWKEVIKCAREALWARSQGVRTIFS
jgi:hypothetical protein